MGFDRNVGAVGILSPSLNFQRGDREAAYYRGKRRARAPGGSGCAQVQFAFMRGSGQPVCGRAAVTSGLEVEIPAERQPLAMVIERQATVAICRQCGPVQHQHGGSVIAALVVACRLDFNSRLLGRYIVEGHG